jgi:hypothetical protein
MQASYDLILPRSCVTDQSVSDAIRPDFDTALTVLVLTYFSA